MTAPSKLAPSEAVREALEFYANSKNWENLDRDQSNVSAVECGRMKLRAPAGLRLPHALNDHGQMASAALATIAAQGLVLVPVADLEQRIELATKAVQRWGEITRTTQVQNKTMARSLLRAAVPELFAVKPPAEET